jgi:hypothetical protein
MNSYQITHLSLYQCTRIYVNLCEFTLIYVDLCELYIRIHYMNLYEFVIRIQIRVVILSEVILHMDLLYGLMCNCAAVCDSVRQCGFVRQCGSVRQCSSVRQCELQFVAVSCSMYMCGSVWQCLVDSAHGSVWTLRILHIVYIHTVAHSSMHIGMPLYQGRWD